MTIICYDGKTIAADGQETCEGIIVATAAEKIRTVDGAIYAMAGPSPMWEPLLAWARAGAKPETMPQCGDKDATWAFVVIDRQGARQYTNEYAYPDVVDPPWAWGSNGKVALGAMYSGKTAAEAAKLICEKSVWASGKIQVVNIAEALGVEAVREAAE